MPPICTRRREMCVLFVPEGERCASYLYGARGGGIVCTCPAGRSQRGRGGARGARGRAGGTRRDGAGAGADEHVGRGRIAGGGVVQQRHTRRGRGVVGAQLQRPRKQLPCRAPRRGPVVALRGSAGAGAGHGCEPPPPPPPTTPLPLPTTHPTVLSLPPHYSPTTRHGCEPDASRQKNMI